MTSDSLSGLLPVPMGIFEGPEGEGLLQLVRKLVKHPKVAMEQGGVTFDPPMRPEHVKSMLNMTRLMHADQELIPGLNIMKNGDILYVGPNGDLIGAAATRGNQVEHFYTDKSKGLLAQKAAAEIGKELLKSSRVSFERGGSITKDTYNLLLSLLKKANR